MVTAANIILTKSIEAVNKLFFSDNMIENFSEKQLLLSEDELKNSIIFGPGNPSKGLLNFEFSFGQVSETHVTVEFIETSELLEFILMANDPMARLLSYKISQDINQGIPASSTGNTITRGSIYDRDTNLEDIDEQLKSSTTYYIAYGTSDNIKDWAGPYSMTIMKASLKNTEDNVRTVEATFIPILETHRSWSSTFSKLVGYSKIVRDFNSSISRGSFISCKSKPVPILDSQIRDKIPSEIDKLIRDVLINYLKSLRKSNSNVLVCLPNSIANAKDNKSTEERLQSLGIKISPTGKPMKKSALGSLLSVAADLAKSTTPFGSRFNAKEIRSFDVLQENSDTSNYSKPKGKQQEQGYEAFMEARAETSEDSNNKYPLIDPIHSFCGKITNMGTYDGAQNFIMFEETNISILKLWKEYKLIDDETKPVLIFGDESSIANILYLNSSDISNEETENIVNFYFELDGVTEALTRHIPEYIPAYTYKFYTEDFTDKILKVREEPSIFSNTEFDSSVIDLANKVGIEEQYGVLQRIEGSKTVFRHNISNPNVLELKYNNEIYLAALYNLKVFPKLPIDSINSTRSSITRDYLLKTLGKNFFNQNITDPLYNDKSLNPNTYAIGLSNQPELLRKIFTNSKLIDVVLSNKQFAEEVTDINILAYIATIRDIDIRNSNEQDYEEQGTVLIDNAYRYDSVYKAMYDNFSQNMVSVSIKTLPYFTNHTFIGKECSLIGLDNGLVGSEYYKKLSPYSGKYQIIGWTNTISYDGAFSTFNLNRKSLDGNKKSELTNSLVKTTILKYLLEEKVRIEKQITRTGFYVGNGQMYNIYDRLRYIENTISKL